MSNKHPIFLFASARGSHVPYHRLQREEELVRELLVSHKWHGMIEYISLGQASPEDIYAAFDRFRDQVYIFHYAGYSDGQFLALSDRSTFAQSLAALLGQQQYLKLVFLSYCINTGLAKRLIASGVPAVLKSNIPNRINSHFAGFFYQRLVGNLLLQSFELASSEINSISPKNISREIIILEEPEFDGESQEDFSLQLFIRKEREEVLSWSFKTRSVAYSNKDTRGVSGSRVKGGRTKSEYEEVWLGASVPKAIHPNSEFVTRFAAYTLEYRKNVTSSIETESPGSKLFLDLHSCQWEVGTKVHVNLTANGLNIELASQSFTWNGKWTVLRFDVSVPDSTESKTIVLRFDVYVEGFLVAKLRPEIQITPKAEGLIAGQVFSEVKTPQSAFASYASDDRREVLGRIRSLQIFTGIDVFLDCLSIRPGEKWKDRIKKEISNREVFWLFWSRSASQSPWVEWEWQTALEEKTIQGIQPHPLEPSDLAPPPTELEMLQFGSLYESLSQSKSGWWPVWMVQIRKILRRLLAVKPFLLS